MFNNVENINQSGIYSITFHTPHGIMFYIGSTVRSFKKRFYEHIKHLKRNNHHSKKLQAYWNKYKESVEFKVIDVYNDLETITDKEQEYIENIDDKYLLNLGPAFPNPRFGKHNSPELCKRISEANRRRIYTPEMRKHMSASQKGRTHSLETRKRIGDSNRGKIITVETREKLRQANIGHHPSKETIEKMSVSQTGRKHSPETRAKITFSVTQNKQDPLGHDKRVSAAKRGWETRKRKYV